MKKKTNLLMLLLGVAIIFISACNNEKESNDNLPEVVLSAFAKQFPNATNVKWVEKNNYYVASFDLTAKSRTEAKPGNLNEVWYTSQGSCGLIELELSMTELEQDYNAVFASWKKSVYFTEGYQIDDVDLLQRDANSDDKIVKIEIEKGELERELYFATSGLLVKDMVSSDDDEQNLPCPQQLTDYINNHYSDAIIVDFEVEDEDGTYEVEILFAQTDIEKELVFNKKYELISIEIDMNDDDLIELIKSQFTADEIAGIVTLTGEADMSEWEVELREDAQEIITFWVEDAKGVMTNVKVVTL